MPSSRVQCVAPDWVKEWEEEESPQDNNQKPKSPPTASSLLAELVPVSFSPTAALNGSCSENTTPPREDLGLNEDEEDTGIRFSPSYKRMPPPVEVVPPEEDSPPVLEEVLQEDPGHVPLIQANQDILTIPEDGLFNFDETPAVSEKEFDLKEPFEEEEEEEDVGEDSEDEWEGEEEEESDDEEEVGVKRPRTSSSAATKSVPIAQRITEILASRSDTLNAQKTALQRGLLKWPRLRGTGFQAFGLRKRPPTPPPMGFYRSRDTPSVRKSILKTPSSSAGPRKSVGRVRFQEETKEEWSPPRPPRATPSAETRRLNLRTPTTMSDSAKSVLAKQLQEILVPKRVKDEEEGLTPRRRARKRPASAARQTFFGGKKARGAASAAMKVRGGRYGFGPDEKPPLSLEPEWESNNGDGAIEGHHLPPPVETPPQEDEILVQTGT